MLRVQDKFFPQGVDYKRWSENGSDLEALEGIIQHLESNGPYDSSTKGQIAYYANAYNLYVLDGVLKEYPIKSVREVAFAFGFFTRKRQTLNGEKMSLNHLEKQILIKEFKEARVHFIINCASGSCPPLPTEPLTADNLERIMEASATAFINKHRDGVRKESPGQVDVSKIFDWYHDDFENDSGSILAFINKYRMPLLNSDTKIKFLDYDWTLNDTSQP